MKKSKLLGIVIPTSILGLGTLATGMYFIGSKINHDYRVNSANKVIQNINNVNTKVKDEFIKGADVSSYAEVVENLLFEHNIKKDDGSWYTYKDIENPDIKITDNKTKKLVTLEEYINNNLYSYFDENSNRVYDNMFNIIKKKGITSLRLRFWVNPYDVDGNSYGGGHNDLDTNIFIMNQAKKYGIDDFLIVFHYSDFWADPDKHYIPKDWENQSDDELLQTSYDYTKNVLNEIYNRVGIVPKRIQYGNEISKGFLDKYNEKNKKFIRKSFNFLNQFIIKGIDATNDFIKENPGTSIDKNIHIEGNELYNNLMKFKEATSLCDSIQFSFYLIYRKTLNTLPEQFNLIRSTFPNQKLYMGEVSLAFSGKEDTNINEAGISWSIGNDWNPEIQAFTMFQHMQLLSKLLPDIETGFYWWEIGQLYIGRLSWATKEGIKYFKGNNYSTWKDINNWSSNICFDKNAIALPVLDVISHFERNINLENYDVYKPDYFKINLGNKIDSYDLNYFIKKINFLWPKNFDKKDLSKILFDKNNKSAIDNEIDIEIYLNNQLDKFNENLVINEIEKQYISLMYNQINFSDFEYNNSTNIGSIKLTAKDNSFYYIPGSNITLKFKVYNEYLINTIDLTNNIIDISKNDNFWYKKIINFLNSQKDYAFGSQIWNYLKISGGATDDDNIWLYDNNKNVNRNAEFFLLKNDQIRLSNNKVDYDILNKNKIWVNNFNNYKTGINDIYFAVRKGINDLNLENSTNSTFSEVGTESWKYIDLLIYKLKINIK